MKIQNVLLLLLVVASTGCTFSEPQQAALVLGAYTSNVKATLAEYADRRRLLAEARLRAMAELEANAMASERQSITATQGWLLSNDKPRLDLYGKYLAAATQLASKRTDEAVAAQRRDSALKSLVGVTMVRAKELAATIDSLSSLSHEKSVQDELAFYQSYFGEVQRQMKEAQKASQDQAGEAKKMTEAAGARAEQESSEAGK